MHAPRVRACLTLLHKRATVLNGLSVAMCGMSSEVALAVARGAGNQELSHHMQRGVDVRQLIHLCAYTHP